MRLPLAAPKSPSLYTWRSHLLPWTSSSLHVRHLLQTLSLSVTSSLLPLDPFFSSRLLSSLLLSHSLSLSLLLFSPSPFAFNSLLRSFSLSPSTHRLSLPLFRLMLRSRLRPDPFTLPFLLRSSPSSAPLLHSLSLRLSLHLHPHVATSLLHSYALLGLFHHARQLFDEMPLRTPVTYNALISSLSKSPSHLQHALSLFTDLLRSRNTRPNTDTLVAALSCCAALGALTYGRSLHALALRRLDRHTLSPRMSTALIHMYCKCGCLESGRRVFGAVENRDVSAWTAMIGGLAMHGCGEEAVGFFGRMVDGERVLPDALVFTNVLHACSHSGLVERGVGIFDEMRSKYRVDARMEHYGAMVDLFGRAGRLEEAEGVVRSMPFKANRVVWGALLHACFVNGEVEFGKRLEREVLEEEDGSGFYVGVSNVYAKEGRWDEVGRVRGRMMEKGVRKESGFSLVEVNGIVHKFVVGDARNSLTEDMNRLLCSINKKIAYDAIP